MAKQYGRVDVERAVHMYTVQHLTLREIGRLMGATAAGVSKALRNRGVTAADGERVKVACETCGETFDKFRNRWRQSKRHYCSEQCYSKSMRNPEFSPSHKGCRAARKLVGHYFDLQPEHCVHHHDSNESNNAISNLAVFASSSDHTSFERGGGSKPIWDGRGVTTEPISVKWAREHGKL